MVKRNLYIVDNAIIMAAGVSSRFAPLSYERPKALTEVRGEILIERQIRQLHEAGIHDVYVIVGYMAEQFEYLQEKLGVHLIKNDAYMIRNNHSSIFAAKDVIRNTYICSADNYFLQNPFEKAVEESYYAAVYAAGETREWCMDTDSNGYITHVEVGGKDAWFMLGHAFWSEEFSAQFLRFLEDAYDLLETKDLFWENIFMNHLDALKMKMRKYPQDYIYEFDSIDELRMFDQSYVTHTRSRILKHIAKELDGTEAEIVKIKPIRKTDMIVTGIQFVFCGEQYTYDYFDGLLRRIGK